MNSCIEIPIIPRIAIAKPTSLGGIPSPPVKTKGNFWCMEGGLGCFGSETGVERKTNQRLLNVPRWVAISVWATRVQITLYVNIRRNGSLCFHLGTALRRVGVVGVTGVMGTLSSPARAEYSGPESPCRPQKISLILRAHFVPRSSWCRIDSKVCGMSVRPRRANHSSYLFEPEEDSKCCRNQEESAQDIWWCVRKSLEKFDIPKELGITACRVCQKSTKNRANNDSNIEAHWKQQKCPRLISVSQCQ